MNHDSKFDLVEDALTNAVVTPHLQCLGRASADSALRSERCPTPASPAKTPAVCSAAGRTLCLAGRPETLATGLWHRITSRWFKRLALNAKSPVFVLASL